MRQHTEHSALFLPTPNAPGGRRMHFALHTHFTRQVQFSRWASQPWAASDQIKRGGGKAGEEISFLLFRCQKSYCAVSVLQAPHNLRVVFNHWFWWGTGRPKTISAVSEWVQCTPAAICHPELGDGAFPRNEPSPCRFTPGTGRPAAARNDGAGGADAPIFKATHLFPSVETEGRALELSHGGPWHRADGSGLVTRC